MYAWDASWKPLDTPGWFTKAVRARYRRRQNVRRPGPCGISAELNAGQLWTHWGSVKRGKTRAVIAQPYSDETPDARQWAADLGCALVMRKGGPWDPATWYYEFVPFGADSVEEPPKYPFATMGVGDGFDVEADDVYRTRNALRSYGQKRRASRKPVSKFCQRKEPGTSMTRFFRTA
jgi:hypothetical protein